LDPQKVNEFKAELLDTKERLIREITRLEETGIGDTMSDSVGELSVYDNHPADLGDELFERSKDVALRDNAHILLEEVEEALTKIIDQTYGFCSSCGQPIAMERLEALPWATHCIACQRQEAVEGPVPRPLEEELLAPPFHRTFLDTAKFANVGFDGEDSLQAVMRWGSSDSPQDIPGSYDYKALWPNSNEHEGIVDRMDAVPAEPGLERSPYNEKAARRQKKDTEQP
jgi:YteA family regulatory protein